ncbi:MAG: DUF3794 domain-containing protein [Clostridia bacterium]|nr:DUF3794 domain-containing protein [Clostridia bacterium]
MLFWILHGIINLDNCMSQMKSQEKINIKKIETKILNGRKINIKVILEVELKVYSNDNISLISNINNLDDIQMLNSEKKVNSLLGEGCTKVYAKDNIAIEAEDDLAEIMKVEVKIVNKDIKLSYNKVLAKAELNVSIMYLTEDNRVKNVSAQVPIMGFIDIENIADNNTCDINYCIKNIIIKPNMQDSHSIYVEAEVEIECWAYEEKNINLIEDLYSISENLNYNQKEITTMCDKKTIKDACTINDQIQIPEIDGNRLYHVQTEPAITNCMIRNGKAIFEGNLNLEFIYEAAGGMDSRSFEVPFNFELISDNIDDSSTISYEVEIKKDNFIVNGSDIDINIELEFNVSSSKNENLRIINEIETEESENNNLYSMVIYFVKSGDTLWKIAKKFKTTVNEIARVNNIEDTNKIQVGQQLYIPKFVNNQVAV